MSTGHYNERGEMITQATFYALLAARMCRQIGEWAAERFAVRNGSTVRLFKLAVQLQGECHD